MRDPNRIDQLLARLKTIWERNPDLRLAQLFLNMGDPYVLYYVEDEELMKAMEMFYDLEGDKNYD